MSNEQIPIITVTMSTGLQGRGVVQELSKRGKYKIRALTRNPSSKNAQQLAALPNVELIEAELLDYESLKKSFKDSYGIFANTTPTKGLQPLVREHEIEQGKNLINAIRDIKEEGLLKHIVFSSICKAKNPLKNDPAPGHFSSKWDIETYLEVNGLSKLTTIIRPASYFENFDGDLPGLKITETTFPGVVNPNKPWQTIAAEDIGKWTAAIFNNPNRFIGQSINLAGEEMTGKDMAALLGELRGKNAKKVSYKMAPRFLLKLFIHDIGVMADWIERAAYGADLNNLKLIAKEENIQMTSLAEWLKDKQKVS